MNLLLGETMTDIIRTSDWRSNALQTTLSLSLRSIRDHGALASIKTRNNQMRLPVILQTWCRLITPSFPPTRIVPFCFTDGCSRRLDNRLPNSYPKDCTTWAGMCRLHERGLLDQALGKIFLVHLHNQWHKSSREVDWWRGFVEEI
ncbi:uncharacterized protein FOMMEDRAFT_162734 [Fomitiporia mediterranea MF3/22]|uniref:Uncharacterized protein n=1 Tax=Fomitiporia mediterranea (strain MF3/22) TaxID=694068 RepID=R7SG73_FOMME|nr:uncharacterized protein FOMMEDRAFT_162734 [Fomitiporia mediterranea MF3/22]EJC97711.1 hypothetical protein FOMMEDRAFT_162734 [Fomitiporia mediterranea MF3/22]